MGNLAIANLRRENSELRGNIPSEENIVLIVKSAITETLTKSLNTKPTTKQILDELLKRTNNKIGQNATEQEIVIASILENMFNVIFNYPSAKKITKNDLQEITSIFEGKIPKYELQANSKGSILIKYNENENQEISGRTARVIFNLGAMKDEKELIDKVNEIITPLITRFENAYSYETKENALFNEVKRDEITLAAEELMRALNSLYIEKDGEKIPVKIDEENGTFVVSNYKNGTSIVLDPDKKATLYKLQDWLINSKVFESIINIADKSSKKAISERYMLLHESQTLYNEFRDLGIIIDTTDKGDEISFEFPFGGKILKDTHIYKDSRVKCSLPYTKEMIKDYEHSYKNHYSVDIFSNYLEKNAEEDKGYKKRQQELKRNRLKRNFRGVIENISDNISDFLILDEGIIEETLSREEKRRGKYVKNIMTENRTLLKDNKKKEPIMYISNNCIKYDER